MSTPNPDHPETPEEFWQRRYGSAHAWSGRVNSVLATVVTGDVLDGRRAADGARALDLGSGEGGDAIWLAERGFDVTGLDLSPVAVTRATEAAVAAEVAARTRFRAVDLSSWVGEDSFDLVTASFLQSPFDFGRAGVLRRAADLVRPGGHLFVLSHAAAPSWAGPEFQRHHATPHDFPSPASELADLDLDPEDWQVRIAEVRERAVTAPDGAPARLSDTVVLVRRASRR